MVPIGFVSDHMEVVYDLDTEARATAEKPGCRSVGPPRPAWTRGSSRRSATCLERAAVERGEEVVRASVGSLPGLLGRLPGRLLPQRPRRRPACAGRRRLVTAGNAELADLALRVARRAAELVRERRTGEVTVADTKSSDVDIVTEADRASEALIRDLLLTERPDDGVLGEEGDDVPSRSGVRWVVDPIDGTVNFLYGLPQYAVSIAAERDGEVVAGVVLSVAQEVEYVAHRADVHGRRSPPVTAPPSPSASPPRCRCGSCRPGSTTTPGSGPSRPARSPG